MYVSMSLVFTISAWLVNFTYFAYFTYINICFFVKDYCKIIYICYLHIRSYIDKFYTDYVIVMIKVAKFSKIPKKKDKKPSFRQIGKHDKANIIS